MGRPLDRCRCVFLFGCVAAALAVAAPAYAGEGGETGFQIQLVADRTVLTPENPTATITLMMGSFGQGGAGPYYFRGLVSTGEPLSLAPGGALSPFETWIEEQPDSSSIDLSIVRQVVVQPPPPAPPPPAYGVDDFVAAYVFTVSATDFGSQTSMLISAEGEGNSILEWQFLLGVGLWGPNTGPLEPATAELELLVVPAPSGVAPCLLMLVSCGLRRGLLTCRSGAIS